MPAVAPKHPANVRVFEDRQTPALKQRTFPYRRHSARRPSTPATAAIWRQPSLTQTVPSLARLSSSRLSFDGVHDLEYDSLTPAMPPKKKSRKSNTGNRIPDQRTPDQTTITQMDPFRKHSHPEDELEHLKEELPTVVDTPPRTKDRRRLSRTPATSNVQTRSASKIQTRSTSKKRLEAETAKEVTESQDLQGPNVSYPDQGTNTSLPESQGVRMPPPATPKRTRKKVIPSSQSPADTPISLSRHRRKDGNGDPNRTPLQECSANTPSRSRFSSRRKTVQWAPKLLVADSTAFENEDLEDPFPPIVQSHTAKDITKKAPLSVSQGFSKSRLPSTPVHRAHSLNRNTPKALSTGSKDTKVRVIKRTGTIADSEDEDNVSLSRSPERNLAIVTINSNPTPLSIAAENASSLSKTPDVNRNDFESNADASDGNIPQNEPYNTVPTQLIDQPTKSTPPLPLPNKTPAPLNPTHSDPSEASAQLESELLLSSYPAPITTSSPPALETESQFDNAWRELTPPDDIEPTLPEPTLPQSTVHPDPSSSTDDSPALLLPPVVPPSQASTTDITQTTTPHRARFTVDDHASSSPVLRARRGEEQLAGYRGWDGVPLTDSELLPASLMEGSLELPVMEEEMEMEMELEMEG